MIHEKGKTIRLAAVGDLLLSAKPDSAAPARGLEALAAEVREIFASCDIVFANLECTLPGPETVPMEPRVVSTEKQIRSLKDAGINIVTLGNNHAFDCLDEGFDRVRGLLTEMAIPWCGAGLDLAEALRPALVEVGGVQLAFLGVVDKSSGPFRFAGETVSGVAPLDTEKICHLIKELRQAGNHVIVSPHWGEERFRIPSPLQIETAKAFVDAGACLVLGHHPHVLQGMERYRAAPIAYSLGNFLANEVYWRNGDFLTWNRFERVGCILVAELGPDGVREVRQIPVVDDGKRVRIDRSGWGGHCLNKVNRLLAQGVTPRRYRWEQVRVNTLGPICSHLRWSGLRRIRPKHFRKALQLILRRQQLFL